MPASRSRHWPCRRPWPTPNWPGSRSAPGCTLSCCPFWRTRSGVRASGRGRAGGHRRAARRNGDRPLAASGSAEYTALAAMLAIMVGLVFLVARLARLGWIADYFSQAVLVGYITGVAIVLVLGQLGKLVGISSDEEGAIRETLDIFRHVGDANGATVIVGALAPRSCSWPAGSASGSPAHPRGPASPRPRTGPRRPGVGHRPRAQRTARGARPVTRGRQHARRRSPGRLRRGVLRLHPHGPLLRRPPPRGRRRQPGACSRSVSPRSPRASRRASRSGRAGRALPSTTTCVRRARSAGSPPPPRSPPS